MYGLQDAVEDLLKFYAGLFGGNQDHCWGVSFMLTCFSIIFILVDSSYFLGSFWLDDIDNVLLLGFALGSIAMGCWLWGHRQRFSMRIISAIIFAVNLAMCLFFSEHTDRPVPSYSRKMASDYIILLDYF